MNKYLKYIIVAVAVLLIVTFVLFSGKREQSNPTVPSEFTTVASTDEIVVATEVTFPDETGFYAIGGYSEEEVDFGATTAATEETQNTEATKDAESTDATDPDETVLEEDDPDEVVLEEDTPKEETVPPTTEGGTTEESGMTYERYNAMSPEQQLAFFNTFDSPAAFTAWYQAAQADYENRKNSVEVGNGVVDIGGIVNGNNG